ncbi:hypothetical protein KM043_016132 [Ampulex compressa]|nr:hypothetical protein KM043_016132 [Ampulex compressa]
MHRTAPSRSGSAKSAEPLGKEFSGMYEGVIGFLGGAVTKEAGGNLLKGTPVGSVMRATYLSLSAQRAKAFCSKASDFLHSRYLDISLAQRFLFHAIRHVAAISQRLVAQVNIVGPFKAQARVTCAQRSSQRVKFYRRTTPGPQWATGSNSEDKTGLLRDQTSSLLIQIGAFRKSNSQSTLANCRETGQMAAALR